MQQPTPSAPMSYSARRRAAEAAAEASLGQTFSGVLDSVLVDPPVLFSFDGAVSRPEANGVWVWLTRDVATDLIPFAKSPDDPGNPALLTQATPEILTRARAAVAETIGNPERESRLRAQLGDATIERLPVVLNAFKCHPLLAKAQAYGRALNGILDDAALATAMRAMPLQDTIVAPFLLMAAVGQVVNPSRLVVAATKMASDASDTGLVRAGLGPLIDAMLAHAQNALPPLLRSGTFVDMDLACRGLERFHRLIRALNGNLSINRTGRYSQVIAGLTKAVSDRLLPKIRDVTPDVNQALRRLRDGTDRLDGDSILSALNGLYLLVTVRDCRDSLALNEIFNRNWDQSGQALEMHLNRNLEELRDDPTDRIVAARLEAGIKMAAIRFGIEYADVLRRARDAVERRIAPPS